MDRWTGYTHRHRHINIQCVYTHMHKLVFIYIEDACVSLSPVHLYTPTKASDKIEG